ncbi:hypothetical protein JIN84_01570 [Luteolibacter yonseiensis]|uniref:Uncharacterized protein n=1 Tax=Luteolibacter yonseiensis TaxID=1144680 RepID=A0A934V9Y8_9BACT|nr:hypothetical protein [Luteolibacter yonseiensis]MBK1814296.1 hypothetical protein [Luteolibacter yonseiensis]
MPSVRKLFTTRVLCAALLAMSASLAHAFPPAPHYTIYGMVRDQVGQTVTAEGATIILLKDGAEIGRTLISTGRIDQNYELNIRIDQARNGTAFYSEKAVAPQGVYSLVVEMNGSLFYPIEVSGTLRVGKGGERVKLDLNLGEDSDRDGLPDVWEQWQLYQAGHFPGDDGQWDLGLISRNGDFDKDGQSNYLEYLAGTFAGDATETFALSIKEKTSDRVRLEFFGITGKVYTLESTSDLKNWSRVPFTVGAATEADIAHRATGVGIVSAFTALRNNKEEFYRLTVR